MKILLVEGDLDQLDVTAYMLRREHFTVVEASDGTQALRRLKTERPDLVILNLASTPSDGFEVLRQIRADDHTPVLVVTSQNDRSDADRSFELGADDFVAKPYVFRELTLRVRALVRHVNARAGEELEPPLEHGHLRLDAETHEVARGAHVTRLTPTEFRIFYVLVKSAEHVVPANRLYRHVWGSEGGAANSLRSHICHLRKKLALDGSGRGSISSVPGVGYLFRAESLGTEPVAEPREEIAAGT